MFKYGQTKEDACQDWTTGLNKRWFGGPAKALKFDKDVPIIGCKDCDCCKPGNFNF